MGAGVKGLTDTQARVLFFIVDFMSLEGYPPTLREMQDCFGWSSTNAARDHLRALVRKGYVTVAPGLSRGIRVLSKAPC